MTEQVVVVCVAGSVAAAPGPGGPVRVQADGVPGARADGGEGRLGHTHTRGRCSCCFGACTEAQLLVLVVSPGPDVAVPVQSRAVVGPGADGDERHAGGGGGLAGSVGGVAFVGVAAELYLGVVSPGPDVAIPVQGHGVSASGGHLGEFHSRGRGDTGRSGPVCGGAVAELAVLVVAPCVQVAVAADGEGVGLSGGYLGEPYPGGGGVDAHVGAAPPGPLGGVGSPPAPPGGQGRIPCYGLGEVVGLVSLEPSVEGPPVVRRGVVGPSDGVADDDLLGWRG